MAIRRVCCKDRFFEISYVLQSNNANHYALFLHGWGANKELMQGAFGGHFKNFNQLYLDLPGFGNSSNEFVLNSLEYAEIIRQFLMDLEINPQIIIAHSFGGKIAVLLQPKILVLLSSAGIKKQKSLIVKIKIMLAKMLKTAHIKSSIFRTKDAQNLPLNMYETLKKVVDEDFREIFGNFCGKAFIFWGKDDDITPLYMAHAINAEIKESKLYLMDGNHFFFLQNADSIDRLVNEAI